MKLMDIDRKRYRKHLNWVFAGIAAALFLLLFIVAASPLIEQIPLAALVGVMLLAFSEIMELAVVGMWLMDVGLTVPYNLVFIFVTEMI